MMSRFNQRLRKIVFWKYAPLFLIVLFNLAMGSFIAPDYGIGWDETGDVQYGEDALRSYGPKQVDWENYGKRKYYGPAFFMLQGLTAKTINSILPTLSVVTIRHYFVYAFYQIAIVAFFLIVERLFSRTASYAITLIFAFQPLYFGHAFINGKDIPFMAMFLLTIALGIIASDYLSAYLQTKEFKKPISFQNLSMAFRIDWSTLSRKYQWVGIFAVLIFTVLLFDVYITHKITAPILNNLIYDAYHQQAWDPINQLFNSIAPNAQRLPVEGYISKAERLVLRMGAYFFLVFGIGILFSALKYFKHTRKMVWDDINSIPIRTLIDLQFLVVLILCSTALGLTISTRNVGPFAGFLVSLIFILDHRGRAVAPLIFFWMFGLAITYLSWPYLWSNPVVNYQASLAFMANHPWRGYVLYLGEVTKGRLLPWYYLPHLMLIQFTEPAWLLFLVGMAVSGVKSIYKRIKPSLRMILPVWFLLPVIPMSFREDVWLYDNFRQFLFVTPAIFITAGLGFEWIFKRFRQPLLKAVITLVALTPGLIGIVNLHPYQYVYFNSFVGGTKGAEGRYELDYWCTSYSQAIQKLNPSLSQDETIAFLGTTDPAKPYVKPGISLSRFSTEDDLEALNPDIVVICNRANLAEVILSDRPEIFHISAGNTPLTAVKRYAP